MNTVIPKGYKQDASGRLVPISMIKDIDIQRDELVQEIVGHAQSVNEHLVAFKRHSFGDIQAFKELSSEKYGKNLGGKKGNITLHSFDGKYKVQVSNAENISFDERLQVAKQLVDQCIHRWTEGSNDNIKALVEHAFQTDKEGNISIGRILGLMKLNINDADWKQAMEAIKDSMQVIGTKTYIRIYQRDGDTENYTAIALDIAGV